MIFTHSYNKTKSAIELKKRGLINAVYINKVNKIAKNPISVLKAYEKENIEVIFDAPVYISTFMKGVPNYEDEISDKNLDGELILGSIVDYKIDAQKMLDDLKIAWENYVAKLPKSVSPVLSLPTYFLIKSRVPKIVSIVPKCEYKYSSWAIDFSNLRGLDVEQFVSDVNLISNKINSNKVLLTFKTSLPQIEYSVAEVDKIKLISEKLKVLGIDLIFHHAQTLFPLICEHGEFAMGFHNQAKIISSALPPFVQNDNARSKTATFFSSQFCSEFKINGMKNLLDFNSMQGISFPEIENAFYIFKNQTKDFDSVTTKMGDEKESEIAVIVNDFIEFEKLKGENEQSRESAIRSGISLIEGMTALEKDKVIYKYNATLYKKALRE